MRNVVTGAMVAAVLAMTVGCAGKPAPTVRPPVDTAVLAKAGLQYYWDAHVELDPGESVKKLWRLDENLYCLTSVHRLVALDARTGIYKWSVTVSEPHKRVFPPTHAENVAIPDEPAGIWGMTHRNSVEVTPFDAVMVNTIDSMLVVDRLTGEVKRRIALDFNANTGGASDGAFFFVGSARGWYHAIRLFEAVELWWKGTDSMITAPPVAYRGRLYVASEDGRFYVASIPDKKVVWKRTTDGAIVAAFHVDRRGCFVGSEDGRLYAFDLAGGDLWHPFVCQVPLRWPPQVAQNTVFQYAPGENFYAINLSNGNQRWTRQTGRRVLTVIDGQVYLLDADNVLLIVDEVLGRVINSLPMTGFDLFVPNTAAPAIYTGTTDGKLFCIMRTEAGHLSPDKLREGPTEISIAP